jgi:hypothetical protein
LPHPLDSAAQLRLQPEIFCPLHRRQKAREIALLLLRDRHALAVHGHDLFDQRRHSLLVGGDVRSELLPEIPSETLLALHQIPAPQVEATFRLLELLGLRVGQLEPLLDHDGDTLADLLLQPGPALIRRAVRTNLLRLRRRRATGDQETYECYCSDLPLHRRSS